MSVAPFRCLICSGPSPGYNYGIIACNACKMFFHRVVHRRSLYECINKTGTCTSNCQFCRFQKCLNAGMVYQPLENTHDFQKNEAILPAIVNGLIYMNDHRVRLLNTCYVEGDPAILDITESLRFIEKPKDYKSSYKDWGFNNSIFNIDFLKKFNFMKNLDPVDQTALLKNNFLKFNLFSLAYASYSTKKSSLFFPDGTQIPEDNVPGVTEAFRNRIQSRLINKLIELNITKDEFLLLSVVFLCDPGAFNLSESGANIIGAQQKYYSSALLKHCQLNNQAYAPSRFTDLLFIYQVIVMTYDDLTAHYQLRQLHNSLSGVHNKKIFVISD